MKRMIPFAIVLGLIVLSFIYYIFFTHTHDWKEATCLEPKTCTKCGETEGEALGHKWVEADCTTPKTCSVCNRTEGEPLGHKWSEATCSKPKTCTLCGATEGEALEHIWIDATCTKPKTCSVCGKKVGSPLGHDVDDMTCTTGGTCNRCGDEVEAPGHKWMDATCTKPKTCSICGETDGEALGHTTSFGKCSRCGLEFYDPIKGNGDDVLTDINLSDGLYKAHIVYSGAHNFVVWIYDENNYKDLLVNTIGSYDGYVLIASPTSIYLEIKSSGDWSIQFEKLTNTSETSFSGNGDNVTGLFSSSVKKWHIHYEGEHNFVVRGYSTNGTDLLVNTIGSYDGNVLFEIPSGGRAFFEVTSSGSWSIEPA